MLVFFENTFTGQKHYLHNGRHFEKNGRYLIGRSAKNDLKLKFPEISRHQATLVLDEGTDNIKYVLVIKSTNDSTYVNNKLYNNTNIDIKHGDTVIFGRKNKQKFEFKVDDSTDTVMKAPVENYIEDFCDQNDGIATLKGDDISTIKDDEAHENKNVVYHLDDGFIQILEGVKKSHLKHTSQIIESSEKNADATKNDEEQDDIPLAQRIDEVESAIKPTMDVPKEDIPIEKSKKTSPPTIDVPKENIPVLKEKKASQVTPPTTDVTEKKQSIPRTVNIEKEQSNQVSNSEEVQPSDVTIDENNQFIFQEENHPIDQLFNKVKTSRVKLKPVEHSVTVDDPHINDELDDYSANNFEISDKFFISLKQKKIISMDQSQQHFSVENNMIKSHNSGVYINNQTFDLTYLSDNDIIKTPQDIFYYIDNSEANYSFPNSNLYKCKLNEHFSMSYQATGINRVVYSVPGENSYVIVSGYFLKNNDCKEFFLLNSLCEFVSTYRDLEEIVSNFNRVLIDYNMQKEPVFIQGYILQLCYEELNYLSFGESIPFLLLEDKSIIRSREHKKSNMSVLGTNSNYNVQHSFLRENDILILPNHQLTIRFNGKF